MTDWGTVDFLVVILAIAILMGACVLVGAIFTVEEVKNIPTPTPTPTACTAFCTRCFEKGIGAGCAINAEYHTRCLNGCIELDKENEN